MKRNKLHNNSCGRSSSVEHQLPKLDRRVQFPSPALCLHLLCFLLLVFLSGCSTTSLIQPSKPPIAGGFYHRVEKGETLWKISKKFNIDIDELARINRISDNTTIEISQMLFIPSAKRIEPAQLPIKSEGDDFIWPLKGKVITSFGQTFNNMTNKGLNITPYANDSSVLAARSGKVVFYTPNFGPFGKTLIIDHGDGFLTVYSRAKDVFIKTGDLIQKGTVIAKAGSVIHFEIRKGHVAQNPYFYLP